MKLTALLTSLILLSLTAYSAPSSKRIIDLSKQDSKVEFLAIGKPSLLKINGKGGKLNGQLEVENKNVTGLLSVLLDPMTTGIALRDEHMKQKYLETGKFPEATLKITQLTMDKDYFAETGSQKNVPFKGLLKVHGIEKEVEGTADLDSNENTVNVKAKTQTQITSHNIDLPSYLGVKVADKVEINTETSIKKK